MSFEASSSLLALVMNGKFLDILRPWEISIDLEEEIICVEKRNWHLISKDSTEIAFRYVRNIKIDRHLFGADIQIKVVGGTVTAYCLSKSDAREIKEQLLLYNKRKKGKEIIFA